jgi:hypothetical protein
MLGSLVVGVELAVSRQAKEIFVADVCDAS